MAGSVSLLWIVVGIVGLATVAPELDRAVSGTGHEETVADGFAIPRAPDGQFYVDGRIGDVPVRFLIDPGADGVFIAGPDAERIGIDAGPDGAASLPRLTVGPTEVRDIPARIAPDMPVSLLGRAYLSRLADADVRGDRMILR